jgi:hypothetical protein
MTSTFPAMLETSTTLDAGNVDRRSTSIAGRFNRPFQGLYFFNGELILFIRYRFYMFLHTWESKIQIALSSDPLLGYNHMTYAICLLGCSHLLNVNCLLGCNDLLYVNCLLGYNMVQSGVRLSLSADPLFLPLLVATRISSALLSVGSILLLTSVCKDLPQQSEWMTSSELVPKFTAIPTE